MGNSGLSISGYHPHRRASFPQSAQQLMIESILDAEVARDRYPGFGEDTGVDIILGLPAYVPLTLSLLWEGSSAMGPLTR